MGRLGHNRNSYVLTVLLVLLAFAASSAVIFSVSPAMSFAASGRSSDAAGTAVDIAALPIKAVKGVIDLPITRKEVYLLKAGKKISRKEIKKHGGASRYFRIFKIRKDDRIYKRMIGKSYRVNPNIGIKDLRYIKTLYYDFDGKVRVGEIVVNQSIAKDTKEVFRELYKIRYQINKMQLIDSYFPDDSDSSRTFTATDADTASMNDDNTSGFNYRMVAGTSSLSMHGYGRAIDVNPFENPWCPGGTVYYNQKRSAQYANRAVRRPHMIFADSEITKIFRKHGFRWLGATGTRDYQHFEK